MTLSGGGPQASSTTVVDRALHGSPTGGAVRDTLVGLVLVGALWVIFVHFRSSETIQIPAPANKGVLNERHDSFQNQQNRGSGKGSSVTSEEPSELHSIYATSKKRRQPKLSKHSESRREGAPKVVHGVPLEAWVQSQEHMLPSNVPRPTEEKLRVFLQCMELKKKGLEPLEKKECDHLLVKERSNSRIPPVF